MKERPILFKGEMVKAILGGRKTMTRRIVKPQPDYQGFDGPPRYQSAFGEWGYPAQRGQKCPYGRPADRLWVREAFCFLIHNGTGERKTFYRADGILHNPPRGWKPSIHMPRTVSRITLDIIAIKIERLNDISEEDARTEGITNGGCLECGNDEPCDCDNPSPDARDSFINLWESINGPGSWLENPWVWVVEFKRVMP